MMCEDMDKLVESSVTEVFSTMLNFNLESVPPDEPLLNGEQHIASAVGFIGRLTGVVYLYVGSGFAVRITSGLVGIPANEIDGNEMVNDAMGEMANMVVGHIKSTLSDRGLPCQLTIPSIVRGNQFSIEPVSTTQRRVFKFKTGTDQLLVEMLIKPVGGQ